MTRAYAAFSSTMRVRSIRCSGLVAHMAAVGLPETAYRGLGGARLLALGGAAAHLDHRHLVGGSRRAALHEVADAAVFHRDEAGRADQVLLLEPPAIHFRRVALEAEVGPHQVHL